MNTQTKLSISDAAALYKKSRATIYKDIKNGVLSRDNDGLIDFSELIRSYGEPKKQKQQKRIQERSIQNINTSENNAEYNENTVQELKNQIHFLKQQLEKAEDREQKANERIDTLLTLIEMKKPIEKETVKNEETPKNEVQTEPEKSENKSIERPTKKGLLKRIFGN